MLPVLDESDFPNYDPAANKDVEAMVHFRALVNMDYAVVAFTPEELRGVDPDKVQDRLIELGYEVINDLEWFERESNDE